jgi:Tol biopolymer transport system component
VMSRQAFSALATDGNRIFFSTLKDETLKLAYMSVTGGDQVLMAVPLNDAEVRNISPDGSLLLAYGSIAGEVDSHLWLVPTVGGGPRRLGNIDGHDGAWSPDGRQFVFANGQDLYLAESDGSNSRKLTTLPGMAFWIRWAPGATRIRFTLIDPKTSVQNLWECSADGTHLQRLPLIWQKQPQECCGEWTPDGRYFLFRVFQDSRADIWMIHEGRTQLWRSAQKPARFTTGPMNSASAIPSRDGKKLFAIEMIHKFELHRYDLKTRRFSPFLPGISALSADFSPDRQWVTYVEQRGKEAILWRSKLDGSERLQLTNPPLVLGPPRFSPDGRQIAFWAKMPEGLWNNYLVPAGGGSVRSLPSQDRNAVDGTWSPDGQSVMFGQPPDNWAEASTTKAIHILNLKTNQITNLPGSEGLFSPRWSPNGRYVAAMPLSQQKLMLFDFATQSWTELASHCTDNPAWSRDSAYVYFNGCDDTLMRVGRVSSKLEQIMNYTTAVPHAISCRLANATWDGTLLIGCAVYDSDIYALDLELP